MNRKFSTMIGMMTLAAMLLLAGGTHAAETGPIAPGTTEIENNTTIKAAAGGDHGGHAKGEPKLIGPFSAGAIPALTSLVVFILLLVVLGKFAWGPIAAGLKAREDKIRKDIADAEAARARAEGTLKEYTAKLADTERTVREMIAKAAADAEGVAQSIRTRAQQESEETKEKAIKEIDAARVAAVREVYDQAAVLATNIAEKILRRNLNADDQRDLVAQSLEQLQSVGKN